MVKHDRRCSNRETRFAKLTADHSKAKNNCLAIHVSLLLIKACNGSRKCTQNEPSDRHRPFVDQSVRVGFRHVVRRYAARGVRQLTLVSHIAKRRHFLHVSRPTQSPIQNWHMHNATRNNQKFLHTDGIARCAWTALTSFSSNRNGSNLTLMIHRSCCLGTTPHMPCMR